LLTILVGLWYAFWELNQPEPLYGNQPLSYWMARMADPATAAQASSVLREMGPEALPTLTDALHTRSSVASDFAYSVCVKLKLAPERNYDAPNIRATAAYLLGQMGKAAAPAVPDLVEALADQDALVRLKSIRSLAQIGEPSVPELSEALGRPEPEIRFGAAKALGAMGPRARSATNALTLCLNDSQPHVRQAATQALAAIRK
jgi:HEAT repeat protein